MSLLKSEKGQASTEYLIAVTVLMAIVLALSSVIGFFKGEKDSSPLASCYVRAPYSISSSEGSSEQWLKDILMH
jgi:uncharacterized protein (UPF0333 family)